MREAATAYSASLTTREEAPPSPLLLRVTLLTAALALFASYMNLRGEAAHYDGLSKRADRVQENLDELDRDFAGSVILLQPQWGLPLEMLDPLRPDGNGFAPGHDPDDAGRASGCSADRFDQRK